MLYFQVCFLYTAPLPLTTQYVKTTDATGKNNGSKDLSDIMTFSVPIIHIDNLCAYYS